MRTPGLLLAVCLAACSPYEYSKEAAGFGAGVDHLAAAFDAGYANLAVDQASATRQRLLDKRPVIHMTRSCGAPVGPSALSQQPCALYGAGDKEPTLPDLQRSQANARKALQGLTLYVHGLQAVTNAADRKAYNEAAKRLEGGVANLASAANAALPGDGVIAPAVANVALWVVGAALEEDRFDTLKAAVNSGSSYLPTVAAYLATALDEINNARRDVLFWDVDGLVAPLGARLASVGYKERYEQAEAQLAKLDALRHASAAQATKDLLKAHEELKQAVNDPSRNIAPLVNSVTEFVAAAKRMNDAGSRQ